MTWEAIGLKLVDSIPYIIGGGIAFLGGLAGHFLNHRLTAAQRRQEYLRDQLLALVETVYADYQWLQRYRREMCFGNQDVKEVAPVGKIELIQKMHFPDLSAAFTEYKKARHEYEIAADKVRAQRLADAQKKIQPGMTAELALSVTPPTEELNVAVLERHATYYAQHVAIVSAAVVTGRKEFRL